MIKEQIENKVKCRLHGTKSFRLVCKHIKDGKPATHIDGMYILCQDCTEAILTGSVSLAVCCTTCLRIEGYL